MAILSKSATKLQFVPPATDQDGNPIDPEALAYRLYVDGAFNKLFGPGAASAVPGSDLYEIFVGDRLQSPGVFSLTLSAVLDNEGPQSTPVTITVTEVMQTPDAPTSVAAV